MVFDIRICWNMVHARSKFGAILRVLYLRYINYQNSEEALVRIRSLIFYLLGF